MIRRALLSAVSALFLFSCASVEAKQPATVETIDGFTQPGAIDGTVLAGIVDESTGSGGGTWTDRPPVSLPAAIARQHQGSVLALAVLPGTDRFFSGGADGFLSLHTSDNSDETWQLSDIPVRLIAVHPEGNLVAVYESDGFSIHRISVWDWPHKTRLYAKRFRDSVLSLSWSAKGSWLMVGNTSLEGITVLEAKTGAVKNFFKQSPGIVSLSTTGASETSMITYGPSGRILYTDLNTGAERAGYNSPFYLQKPALLNNNLNIAGYADGALSLADATTGKILKSWPTGTPVMATSRSDAAPVWLEEISGKGWILRSGDTVSGIFTVPDASPVTVALQAGGRIVFGTASGRIYALDASAGETAAPSVTALANDSIRRIDDIASDGSRAFILSSGALFISAGPGKAPVFAFDGIRANRLALSGDMLVFWSNASADPVQLASFDGESRTVVYQPKDAIRSLAVSGTMISLVEGTSLVACLDPSSSRKPFTYTGAGLQEAVPVAPGKLVVSKSATMRSPFPLVLIDMVTGETVPLPIQAEICFALAQSDPGKPVLNGFLVKADGGVSTQLVTISVQPDAIASSSVKTEAQYADEDLVATCTRSGNLLLTNLGKNSLVEIRTDEGSQIRFDRGYALPDKASVLDQYYVSLNHDGSMTWFGRTDRKMLCTSAITDSGLWLEQ